MSDEVHAAECGRGETAMKPELKAVLAECNRIRKTLGLPPRSIIYSGARYSSDYCPVTKTIGRGSMNSHFGWRPPGGETYDDSLELRRFAEAFDAGEYPELETKR